MPTSTLKCTNCKERYKRETMRRYPVGYFCSDYCASQYAISKRRALQTKKMRKDTAERKKALKTRSDYEAEAQQVVNEWVRLRDKGKPCCSCDKPDDGSHQRHASHYRSVGAASHLRYYTLNIWASCAQCNSSKSGNLIEYRIRLNRSCSGLPNKLESMNWQRRYEIDYLQRIKKVFRKKIRLYKKLFR